MYLDKTIEEEGDEFNKIFFKPKKANIYK